MMRSKNSSALQKTYDECYLICSTAVYFEGQGNEAEALRSWRSALDQIYYHNAYRVPAGYIPRSETEKALKDGLRDMELQCKERVDLLQALRDSRQETSSIEAPEESTGKLTKAPSRTPRHSSDEFGGSDKGFIGNGTIPVANLASWSRPTPPLPQRPLMPMKNTSEVAVVGRAPSLDETFPPPPPYSGPSSSSRSSNTPVWNPTLAPPMKKSSRSPSPSKGRTMLTTLRSGDRNERKATPRLSRPAGSSSVTNKAASLAWQSKAKSRDRVGRSFDVDNDHSSLTLPGDTNRKGSTSESSRPASSTGVRYDSRTRTLVPDDTHQHNSRSLTPTDLLDGRADLYGDSGRSNGYPFPPTDPGRPGAVAGLMLTPLNMPDLIDLRSRTPPQSRTSNKLEPVSYPAYLKEYPETSAKKSKAEADNAIRHKAVARSEHEALDSNRGLGNSVTANISSPRRERHLKDNTAGLQRGGARKIREEDASSLSIDDEKTGSEGKRVKLKKKKQPAKVEDEAKEEPILAGLTTPRTGSDASVEDMEKTAWELRVQSLMKNLPKGVDEGAAKQIFNEIVVQGDEVHWDDVAGLEIAKKALKEAVVYPFLRPDLFMGLREPARGMLLFGPPGTGKTMLARAVATESRSTFFSISASSLTSKFLGESEKLVRALFSLAKALAPSIIFVDEIDSLLSARSGSGEHEASRRIKTEFLIQWSDLQRAAAGREQSEKDKERGDASRVLVLAATNLPWTIDEAARRRFVRRQYIPLPEDETRVVQLRTLLGHQKHSLSESDIENLVALTDGFSGSDITALAKDAAMGPLRSLGEELLHMSMDQIRPIQFSDFEASLVNIRPSVSKQGLKEFEDWAKEFGERGG